MSCRPSIRRALHVAVVSIATTGAAQADFAFRKPLAIDGSQVQGGPHLDFPVLVSLVDPNLRTVASGGGVQSAQGHDIAFRAADGTTVLDWELERYDGTNGTLVAWVRFPGTLGPPDTRIQNGVNTVFYVYYGDSRITCCQTSHGTVWNAAYREVFHLAGTAGNPVDSTTNGIGSLINPNGDPTATEARGVLSPAPSHLSPIGGGSFDLMNAPTAPPAAFLPTTDSHLRLADGTLAANASFTLETWFYLDALNAGFVGIVTKNRDSGVDWIGFFKNDAMGGHLLFSGWECCAPNRPGNLNGPALLAGRWYHAVATYDNATTTRRLYVDGVQVSTDTVGALYTALTNASRVGDDSNGNYMDGRIDEVRLSTVERSADWIATGARNQSCASGSLPAPACTAPLPYTTPFLAAGMGEPLAGAVTESDCCKVALTAVGNTFTVTTSDSQMVWDTTEGAGLSTFTVEEEAQSGVNRRGDVDKYNAFTMQVNDGTWHFERDASGTMQVLESTPTRTRLRQLYDFTGTLHLDRTWSVYAYPRLAIDETLVNDATQDIRGAQGVHGKGEATCADQTAGNTFFCAGQASGANRIWLVTDNQSTYGDMLAVMYNNTFFGRAGAGGFYEQLFEVGTGTNTYFARVFEPTLLTTIPFADRNLYLFYPRLAGLTSGGTEWQPYALDYRNPDDLTFTLGGGWYDANEGTVSATDEWNEAENAYALDANPASGVSFDLDGGTFTRRKPFFKVRQWRSLAEPSLVTREAANLVNGRDYTADVKPLTRAWSCSDAACTTSTQRANGGLSGFEEFLVSPGNNFTIDLSGTNHLYFGSDSKFRGVNVALFTRGVGAGGLDLQWQYWNGAVWSNLELVGGFTDQTLNFTRNGTVFWTADPGGWAKRNVLPGNADNLPLFYVRVSLAAGSYTTSPVEGLIKTDILLLQYCGDDVAVDFETFTIFAPEPTAVTLLSFGARAALGPTSAPALELAWSTASELQNLGFHLYRGASPDGPWQRLTAALIPGLGSSPTGQAYAWLDATVAAGARYFYLLEDVDTGGQATRHGPVDATVGATDGGDDPPGTGDEDSPRGAAPSWHGDPGTPSFRVIERGPRHLVAELTTPGFATVPTSEGQVEIEIAGFETATEDGSLAVPVRGALVDAVAGRRVRLLEVTASEVLSVPGLRLGTVGPPRLVVTPRGVVRPGVSRRTRGTAPARGGYSPRQWARVEGTGFQGEGKKARLVLSPLRHDPGTSTTVLARRLRVRLGFEGREAGETSLGGSRGRRPPGGVKRAPGVVAHLATKAAGLYRVRFEDVFGAGRGVPVAGLRLSRRGEAVAYHVEPDRALFGPGSSLFFVGGGDLNPNGDAVYELATGQAGLRMKVTSATPSGGPVPLHEAHRTFEENRYYQAGLLETPDLWQWDILVSPSSRDYPFTLQGVAPSSRPARLRVVLQGASDYETAPDHHVRVLVNGVAVTETTWDGKRERIVEADLPAGLLAEGANAVTLENLGDTPAAYSMVFLNRFEIWHPRTSTAQAGVLEGTWFESGAALVSGLDATAVVVDTTATPAWLSGFEASGSGPRFRAEAGHRYLTGAGSGVLSPAVRRVSSTGLRRTSQRADWLLIGPRAFLPSAQPLVELRQGQGLRARAIAIEDIGAEFGHGEAGPEGLSAFLRFAYHEWKRPSPRYVVLLGDSTYDPKDYLKTHVADRVPFRPVLTSYLWTASDPAYAAVNGDDLLPDLAIGRLPAASVAEAEALVTKIVAFESAGRTLSGPAILVADNADSAGAFEAEADEVASGVLAGRPVRKAYLRDLGAATRGEIVAALDGGASFLSYIGHGSTAVWASENVFNSADVAALSAQGQQPLLLTLNCLNGFFHFPPVNSLGEALVKPADRGAIAALSASGLSLDAPAHLYHQAVLREIESGRHARLGDAVQAAQAAYAESGAFPELLLVFHLFGDPALRLR